MIKFTKNQKKSYAYILRIRKLKQKRYKYFGNSIVTHEISSGVYNIMYEEIFTKYQFIPEGILVYRHRWDTKHSSIFI